VGIPGRYRFNISGGDKEIRRLTETSDDSSETKTLVLVEATAVADVMQHNARKGKRGFLLPLPFLFVEEDPVVIMFL
jgi:hypothetical protein